MKITAPSLPRSVWVSDVARVGVLTAMVKLAGGIKTAASARVLGLSGPLDAYLIAFAIVSFLCDSLAGTLPPALVPLFVRESQAGGRRALEECAGGTVYRSVLLLSAVGAALLSCRAVALRLLAPGFLGPQAELTEKLLFVLAPMFPIMAVNAVWRSVLHAETRFAIAAIAPIMTPLVATALLLAPYPRPSIYSLAIGSTIGVFAEMLILGICLLKLGIRVLPKWRTTVFDGRWLRSNYTPLVCSNILHGGVNIVDQSVASLFAAGSISMLALGTRLVSVVMAIVPATLSTVVLPKLSRMVAMEDWEALKSTIKRWVIFGCGAGAALSVGFILLSGPFAALLLQKTSTASAARIHTLAIIQALSFLQLPFVIGGVVLVRAVLSLELNRKLIFISILAVVTNAILDLVLVRLFGVGGIVVSTALVQGLTMIALIRVVRHVFRGRAVSVGSLKELFVRQP